MSTPDYDQGVIAGRIGQRLDGHDKHFAEINGSITKVAGEMHSMALSVQRLADSADADRATAVTLAAALKAADEARRTTSETHWSTPARILAVIITLAAIASVAIGATHL